MLFQLIRTNRQFFICYAVALLILGPLQLRYGQETLMQWINSRNSAGADLFFTYATYLGDGAFFILVCLIVLYYNRRLGFVAIATFALSSLVSLFLKTIVFPGRLRPLKFFEHSTYEYHIIKGLDIYSYNSFPSGHTISAFAVFSLLAFIDERKNRGWFLFLLAFLTGYSRVYLFQHFVEDTYVGSMIGVASSVVIYLALKPSVEQANGREPQP